MGLLEVTPTIVGIKCAAPVTILIHVLEVPPRASVGVERAITRLMANQKNVLLWSVTLNLMSPKWAKLSGPK